MINRFEELIKSIDREGIDKLLAFIQKSDFYTAPASTRFHSCHKGGLLEHSLNVYDCLNTKMKQEPWASKVKVDDDTIKIVALLHDICKTYFYATEIKNRKVYSDKGTKSDSQGKFDWESYLGYTIDDKIAYGHGEQSVMMIEEYMKLKPVERYAIRFHMGFSLPREEWNTLGTAIKRHPLILAISESDLEATYLFEKEE